MSFRYSRHSLVEVGGRAVVAATVAGVSVARLGVFVGGEVFAVGLAGAAHALKAAHPINANVIRFNRVHLQGSGEGASGGVTRWTFAPSPRARYKANAPAPSPG